MVAGVVLGVVYAGILRIKSVNISSFSHKSVVPLATICTIPVKFHMPLDVHGSLAVCIFVRVDSFFSRTNIPYILHFLGCFLGYVLALKWRYPKNWALSYFSGHCQHAEPFISCAYLR